MRFSVYFRSLGYVIAFACIVFGMQLLLIAYVFQMLVKDRCQILGLLKENQLGQQIHLVNEEVLHLVLLHLDVFMC